VIEIPTIERTLDMWGAFATSRGLDSDWPKFSNWSAVCNGFSTRPGADPTPIWGEHVRLGGHLNGAITGDKEQEEEEEGEEEGGTLGEVER